ncbi:MAG: ribonuclease [Acetobacteraceae bacterium]|nr:Ribonuclease 3 [Rhodopila sp.]MEA2729498.1 ribonuclease [Acetobacteraceae bacterium]MEA2768919.1 ribonuclease [Acetobacteraceae bacterium]
MSEPFEAILGHTFKRPGLLKEALTHSSVVHRQGRKRGSNERLEFIGDRVLGLAMAEWLIERFPHEQEGELGPRLAYLVSQPVLAKVAETIGLADALSVGRGEAKSGLTKRATVLADALEAALGALYLDGGLEVARTFVRRAWHDAMVGQVDPPKDAKTALQHWALKRGMGLPAYSVTGRSGPEHAPNFTVTVFVGDTDAAGTAGSKRAAEQLAAEALLARLSA